MIIPTVIILMLYLPGLASELTAAFVGLSSPATAACLFA
jgi:hypothetical protein